MSESGLAQLPRLVRTVRHLRPSQVGWRLRYMVQRRLEGHAWYGLSERIARRAESSHAAIRSPHFLKTSQHAGSVRSAAEELQKNPDYAARLAELQAGTLTLLHRTLPFAGGDDWCMLGGRTEHRLWRYKLHYHGWLTDLARGWCATGNESYLTELRRWLTDWMASCPAGQPGFAHFPWNSYTIAQRLVHWREIDALVPQSFWNHDELPRDQFLGSAAAQAEYLSQHIEWDLRGNHLFKDAVGLAAASELLGTPRWREQAAEIAIAQVAEQILADGMHFERSPMYHIHVLEDLLALPDLLPEESAQTCLAAACRRMAEPLRWLRHPDGRYPLFNDAAVDGVSDPDDIAAELLARKLVPALPEPKGLRHFADAGLVAWHGRAWTVFFDIGTVGPDYQPGHAHADTLTLEASLDGLPLIVDPGTYCYDDDDRRRYDRSTKAHNTVCIDDVDSSEVWHIFRVGRRAAPTDVAVQDRAGGFIAAASHTGYDHLSGSPRHRRQVSQAGNGPLEIRDEIIGTGLHRVEGGFLLAPGWTAAATHFGWMLSHAERQVKVEIHPNRTVELDVAWRPWHPEFGREVSTQRLVWSGNVTLPFRVTTIWQSTRTEMNPPD